MILDPFSWLLVLKVRQYFLTSESEENNSSEAEGVSDGDGLFFTAASTAIREKSQQILTQKAVRKTRLNNSIHTHTQSGAELRDQAEARGTLTPLLFFKKTKQNKTKKALNAQC